MGDCQRCEEGLLNIFEYGCTQDVIVVGETDSSLIVSYITASYKAHVCYALSIKVIQSHEEINCLQYSIYTMLFRTKCDC